MISQRVEQKEPQRERFSVKGLVDGAGTQYTFEWRWDGRAVWLRGSREDKASQTFPEGELRTEDVDTFLDAFGLKGYAGVPELGKLAYLSPSEIIKLRRRREEEENLEYLEVTSDLMNDHVLAEHVI